MQVSACKGGKNTLQIVKNLIK